MAENAGVITVDHTGFSVASLEEAIQFWTEAMGFDRSRRGEMGGDFLSEATGVDDPLPNGASDGSKRLPYRAPRIFAKRTPGQTPRSAGAIGAAYIALTVTDMRTAIGRVETAGWAVKGSPQPIPAGPDAEQWSRTSPGRMV